MVEPDLDCVSPGELGEVVLHVEEGVVAGVLCVEDVGHGDGLVRPVAGSRVDASLSNSGLTLVAAAASVADWQQTAGAIWNRLAAVQRLNSRLHLFPCREKVALSKGRSSPKLCTGLFQSWFQPAAQVSCGAGAIEALQ